MDDEVIEPYFYKAKAENALTVYGGRYNMLREFLWSALIRVYMICGFGKMGQCGCCKTDFRIVSLHSRATKIDHQLEII